MNRTNEALYNRAPRRRVVDVNVDSEMRDRLLYPESNDYRIALPGAPYKCVRSVDVLQMRVPQSESLVHHMQHSALISSAPTGKNAHHGQPESRGRYGEGSDTLCFREGYTIGKHNDQFRFVCQGKVYALQLPHTLTPIGSFQIDDGLRVKCARPPALLPNCVVSVIACPLQLCGEYVVKSCDGLSLLLEPNDERDLDCEIESGRGGYLYLPPPSSAPELCAWVSSLLHATFDIQVQIEFQATGLFVIHKPDGSAEQRQCLIGQGDEDALRCRLPAGPHSLQEVGGALQRLMNPPLIVKGENDTLEFADRWKAKRRVQLEPGHYSPSLLIAHLAELLTAAARSTCSCGSVCEQCEGVEQPAFQGEYRGGQFALYSVQGFPFTLCFHQAPALAFLLGFPPACLADSSYYESRTRMQYRAAQIGNAVNLYSVALDAARSQFTLFRQGTLEVKCLLEVPQDRRGIVIARCTGPHAFATGDVLVLQSVGTLAVVVEVSNWCTLTLACSLDASCESIVSAAPKPFTLPMYLSECNIASVLGFERRDHCDAQYCYASDAKCLPTGELYLLLDCPELLLASEASTKKLVHQTALGEPYRYFVGRLDRYLGGTAFDFTHFGPAQEDLFTGNTITLDTITVRLLKADGKLYDTQKCPHSMVLRIVMEDPSVA